MPTYNTGITRDAEGDPLIPEPVAAEVIKALPKASALLTLARRTTMSSKSNRQPVLSVLPTAYWVNGDTGLKQTSYADWKNVTLIAEELAVLLPIPDAYFEDSQVPIWDEVKPLLVEAIGAKLDAAGLFGTDAPATFPDGVYLHAVAAGNTVVKGHDTTDIAENAAEVAEKIALDGFSANGFATKPGMQWQLVRLRNSEGTPIYSPSLSEGGPQGLYGFPLKEVANGAWDASEAEMIIGDWSKAIVGVRKDITFTKHTDGVISDDSGVVVFNAMQQDASIYRCVFRCAFALANPATRLNASEASRSPFGILQATTANS